MYYFVKMIYDEESKSQRFEVFHELDDETKELVVGAYKNTQELIELHINFMYLYEALVELEKWCNTVKTSGEYLTRNRHTAEKLCRNFLYEFRAFTDHLEAGIKRKHGSDSDLCKLFKDKSGKAYDSVPEYGFTFHLRNCSQHCVDIVHSIQSNVKGLRPASSPERLLKDFDWNQKDKQFIKSFTENIDLQTIFEKTYNAIGIYHQPIMQYLLDHDGVSADIIYLRDWANALSSSKEEIFNWHLMNIKKADDSDATFEDYKNGVPGLEFVAYPIEWKAIYEITSQLTKRKCE